MEAPSSVIIASEDTPTVMYIIAFTLIEHFVSRDNPKGYLPGSAHIL
jgi:hypothetical protein